MRTKEIKPVKKVHLANFHIAGFGFWEGCEAFEHLKVGTRLELVSESNNAFDPYAVAIYYGEYKLGFIPRNAPVIAAKLRNVPQPNLVLRSQTFHLRSHLLFSALKSNLCINDYLCSNQPVLP